MFYVYMCVVDIMNVLRTGMNMYISRIHVWLCYIISKFRFSVFVFFVGFLFAIDSNEYCL